MKLQFAWLIGIGVALTLTLVFSSSADASEDVIKPSRREPKALDLGEPFEKIGRKFKNVQRNFNLTNTINATLFLIFDCLIGQQNPKVDLKLDMIKQNAFNFALKNREQIQAESQAFGFDKICSTGWYAMVHKYVYEEDQRKSMNDILKFMSRFGLPGVYKVIERLYMANNCPQELIDTLPKGPDDLSQRYTAHSTKTTSGSNKQEQEKLQQIISRMTSSRQNLFADFELKCEISELIGKLQGTGIIDLLIFIQTTIHEVIQKPSVHFLIGKVQEPGKGRSFRELRQKESIRNFLLGLDQTLKQVLECMTGLLSTLEEVIGINLKDTHIVELVFEVIEDLVWHLNEPLDPPALPSPLPC